MLKSFFIKKNLKDGQKIKDKMFQVYDQKLIQGDPEIINFQ